MLHVEISATAPDVPLWGMSKLGCPISSERACRISLGLKRFQRQPHFIKGIAFAVLFLGMSGSALGETQEDQYKAYLTRAQTITPLTEFGDQVSLRDGGTSFRYVDVEVAGNGPLIRIVRTATPQEGLVGAASSGNRMGPFELEVPRIMTVTANGTNLGPGAVMDASSPLGWQVYGVNKDARCTNFGAPGDITFTGRIVEFFAQDWWFGYQMMDANGDEHRLIHRDSSLPQQAYKIGTSDHWVVECLPATSNGQPGEAFLARSPDGTKYWFNHLAYTPYEHLTMPFEASRNGGTLFFTLNRNLGSMFVTRIEDRFGNWLTYSYSGSSLLQINASDGRKVSFSSSGGSISSMTVGSGVDARVWTYAQVSGADPHSLVTLPDGSTWQYRGNFGARFSAPYKFTGCDQYNPLPPTTTRLLSVKSPAGASVSYSFFERLFGRSYVHKSCTNSTIFSDEDTSVALNPKLYLALALTSKVVTGPGLASDTTTYSYSSPNASYSDECPNGCLSEVWADVVDGDGTRKRSYFSNRMDQTENKIVREEVYSALGVLVTATSYGYATTPLHGSNPFPWPLRLGAQPDEYHGNFEAETRWTPLTSRATVQDGRKFSYVVNEFDSLARPLKVTQASEAVP